jgi:hypothetical protein
MERPLSALRHIFGIVAVCIVAAATATAAPVPGAIFTTDSLCKGTNVNIFSSKDDVYVDGGPAHPGAAGLPDGEYYVQVTEPNGTILGTSIGMPDSTPVVVSGGEFAACYQLSHIVGQGGNAGYADTSNNGGEYKVWVSAASTFDNANTKTDNFKINNDGTPPGRLQVIKFYDANANGQNDNGEQTIAGWKIRIQDGIDYIRYTPVDLYLDPDDYLVTEFDPIQTNWVHTTTNPVTIQLGSGEEKTVRFGNVCLGPGGGHTIGFWSNKNGQALIDYADLQALSDLNLASANGSAFDPATASQLKSWLQNAKAVNMAYMLSAQLAAMVLNVRNGFVDGGALIYAYLENGYGFVTINQLISAADVALADDGYTPSGDPKRPLQERVKNALDKANNNINFVQPTPCAFSFE